MNEKLYNEFIEKVKKLDAGSKVEITRAWFEDSKELPIPTTADIRIFGRRFKREYQELGYELAELGTKANYVYIKKKIEK